MPLKFVVTNNSLYFFKIIDNKLQWTDDKTIAVKHDSKFKAKRHLQWLKTLDNVPIDVKIIKLQND